MSKDFFKKFGNKKLAIFIAVLGIVLDLTLDIVVYRLSKTEDEE